MSIQILVDSTSDYEPHELKIRGLQCVHAGVHFGEETFRDGIDITKEDFFNRLMTDENFPTTSQPPIAEYLDVFEKAKAQGDAVIYIAMSSGLSGSFQGANTAKEMVGYEHIYIVDSLSITASIQILADYAVQQVRQNKEEDSIVLAQKIYCELETLKQHIKVFASLDTLHYLYKGGRLSKFEAKVGTLAQVKPLVSVNSAGNVFVTGKSIGRKKAMQKLLEAFQKNEIDLRFPITFFYTYQKDNCKALIDTFMQSGVDITGYRLCHVGAAVGTHVGPNAFGFTYVGKEKNTPAKAE